jgi:hypothetical protein
MSSRGELLPGRSVVLSKSMASDPWNALTAISTLLGTTVLTIAAIFGYRQLREATRARQLQATLAVLDFISDPALREARRFVYQHSAALAEKLSSEQGMGWSELDTAIDTLSGKRVNLAHFHTYLSSLENLAILVMHDLAPDDVIEMWFGRMAQEHWRDLQAVLKFFRAKYGNDDFLQHFEMLQQVIRQKGLRPSPSSWLSDSSTKVKARILKARRSGREVQEIK